MTSSTFDRRMSRRSLMGRAGAVTAGATAFRTMPAAAASRLVSMALQKQGGKITIGQVGDLQDLDPFAVLAVNDGMAQNLYDRLVHLDHTITPHPALAESWQVSPDGLKLTLKIRQGVKFHSGAEMTAKDVAANFERARVAATGGNLYGNMAAVSSVTATDATTVELDFSQPAAYFIDALGLQPVVDPAFFDKLKSPVAAGTGPFSLTEWVPGDHATFKKNPAYWDPTRPLVDEARVNFYQDDSAMVAALEGGVLDIAFFIPPREYDRLKSSYTIQIGQEAESFYYLGLSAKVKPFDNKQVRQAMAYALDRPTMVNNVLFGLGKPIVTPFPTFSPAYFEEHTTMYPFDLDKAKAMLTAAGYPNGISFTIPAPSGFAEFGQFAQILQADLAKIGSTVNIQPMDNAQWYPILLNGTYEATFSFAGGTALYPTRIALSSNFPGTGNVAWPDGKAPEAYAKGLADADATFDPAKQKEALKRMADAFMDEAWNLPISFRRALFGNTGKISGLDWSVYNEIILDQVTKSG
jgi:peptide/nickel transport system substrate-binding protein